MSSKDETQMTNKGEISSTNAEVYKWYEDLHEANKTLTGVVVVMRCSRCKHETIPFGTARAARLYAADKGWVRTGSHRYLCPDCVKELESRGAKVIPWYYDTNGDMA